MQVKVTNNGISEVFEVREDTIGKNRAKASELFLQKHGISRPKTEIIGGMRSTEVTILLRKGAKRRISVSELHEYAEQMGKTIIPFQKTIYWSEKEVEQVKIIIENDN